MKNIVPTIELPKSLEKYRGVITGQQAKGDRVSVDTSLDLAQRDFKEEHIKSHIKKTKGLDWNLFGYVTVVRNNQGQLSIIDGQHRIGIVKALAPDITEVPAQIIDTSNPQYAARLFAWRNGGASKTITAEDRFWSEVIAQESQALYLETILKRANLSCGKVNEQTNLRQILNGNTRKDVKFANFAKCVNLGIDATIRAAKLIDRAYPNNSMNDNLFSGLTRLLSHSDYFCLSDPKDPVSGEFEHWFTVLVPQMFQISKLNYPQYRNTNLWYNGVAYGLIQDFGHYQRNQNKWTPSITPMEDIYKAGIV